MLFGHGKIRVAYYFIVGAVLGSIVVFGHELLNERIPRFHILLLMPIVAVIALVMAMFGRSENRLFERNVRLEAARERVNELMLGAAGRRSRTAGFTDPTLCTCWEQLGCDKEDCPAYGQEHARCWLIAGTFCRGQVQGQFAKKLKDCRLCDVYQQATLDPVDEITENFLAMNYLLSENEERLEESYKEARERSEKLAGLVSLSEAALSSVHLNELLENLLDSAASLAGADIGFVSLVDTAGKQLSARVSFGFKPGESSELAVMIGEGLIGKAFAGRFIAVAEDFEADEPQTGPQLKSLGVRSLISLPLAAGGEPTGMLTLGTLTPHRFSEEEKDSLCIAADRIAVAIENAKLAGEVGRDREQSEMMQAITSEVSTGDGISRFYDSFVMHASDLVGFDQASMSLWHPQTQEVEIVAERTSAPRTWMGRGLLLPQDSLAAGRVIESKHPLLREDIKGDEFPTDKLLLQEGIRSAALFPLLSKGEVMGVMQLGSFEVNGFKPDDVQLLEPVTRQLGVVLDSIRLLQEAERSSLIDKLTGLYSHRFFFDSLKRELALGRRHDWPVSIVMLQVHGIKEFNLTRGFAEGDRILHEIAQILQRTVREVDIVARYGGRIFGMLLPEASADGSTDSASFTAHRIREQIAAEMLDRDEWQDAELFINMGIAQFPMHAEDAASLLERAEWALSQANERGRDQIVTAEAGKSGDSSDDTQPEARSGEV